MLLVASSCLFFIPCLIAFYHEKTFYSVTSGILSLASIANHSKIGPTYMNDIFHIIDKIYAHIVAVTYLSISFIGFFRTYEILYLTSFLLGSLAILLYYTTFTIKQTGVHILITIAWICCIMV
jgi:hypothetical protein